MIKTGIGIGQASAVFHFWAKSRPKWCWLWFGKWAALKFCWLPEQHLIWEGPAWADTLMNAAFPSATDCNRRLDKRARTR